MSITDKYGQGFTSLDYGETPDLKIMGDGLLLMAGQSVMRFVSATARNAALTAPVAGMTAWLNSEKLLTVYDGTAWVAVASGTQAWSTPTLRSGYTANGNSNGVPQYRIVNLFGEAVVMWKGGLNVTYSGGAPVSNGNFLNSPLPVGARPASRRTVTAACSAVASDSLSVKLDFNTDGTVAIVTQSGVQPPWVSLNNITYSL
ncbi:hypothetical protein [Streptomyces sp. NRRL F-5135]|uniref:hypothetical protein n=1 Tax=Streptomyces sp. NRRL F-5135 TaxID=1463858 RepID=UPI00068A112A|nr:hypothetical protein [Streptomyces sp. NRRL F-5135]